jgi:hypothetical protein
MKPRKTLLAKASSNSPGSKRPTPRIEEETPFENTQVVLK